MKFKPNHIILVCGGICLAMLMMTGLPELLWETFWPPPRVVEVSRTERSGPFYAVILCERKSLSILDVLKGIGTCGPSYCVVLELRTPDGSTGTYLRQVLGYSQDNLSGAQSDAPMAQIDSDNQRVVLTYSGGETRHVAILSRDYFNSATY
jgi:hypothetical protein